MKRILIGPRVEEIPSREFGMRRHRKNKTKDQRGASPEKSITQSIYYVTFSNKSHRHLFTLRRRQHMCTIARRNPYVRARIITHMCPYARARACVCVGVFLFVMYPPAFSVIRGRWHIRARFAVFYLKVLSRGGKK